MRDATGIKDVRIRLAITKPCASVLSEEDSDGFERQIQQQAEQELVALIKPKLGERRLLLMWD